MNKKLLRNILISTIFLLNSCSYEPIFSKKDYGFSLGEIIFVGDKTVNKNIENRLSFINKKVSLEDSDEIFNETKFDLSINTEKERKVISKDSKGDPIKFEMIVITNLEVVNKNKSILNREIKKSYIYNNVSDKFKLEEDEDIILENISENISESIISLILNLNDN